MIKKKLAIWFVAGLALLGGALAILAQEHSPPPKQAGAPDPLSVGVVQPGLENEVCLGCHGMAEFAIRKDDGNLRPLHISPDRFGQSVHGKRSCVECHKDIAQIPHEKQERHVGCVQCHQTLWQQAQQDGKTETHQRLGVVVKQIDSYMKSVHARPSADDQSRTNATCYNCHNAHYIGPVGSQTRADAHKSIPDTCGKCHVKQRADYLTSVHGKEAIEKNNLKAATCEDCHTTHSIDSPQADDMKLIITKNCGNCHENELKTYLGTYHGQVNKLGYAYTAKCFDCHGSHGILRVDDPMSSVYPDNRLQTCQKCHSDNKPGMRTATPGFITFGPHANSHDFKKYPQMYIATKFMVGLLIFVFAFFWLHSGLWYYREWQDRRQGKRGQHLDTSGLELDQTKHFERFAIGWRIGHLIFALVTMTLVLTGTTALFAQSSWAPTLASILGGPKMLGLMHRIAATLFIGIFMIHLVYVMQKLLRDRTFRWFGPDSLVPNWKDLADCLGMFKWFLGKGPRPQFERWAYYEKFDYWAVFWGVNIIGWTGLMLAFPHVTAQYLPGWVFNVGTIIHGEEAFLAAVFLFTVHFFNNHFRPDKLPPPDVVMFTGTQSLEEFRHDHPAHYKRLLDSGELQKLLVDAPSRPLHIGSVILGLVLLTIGLTLFVLVSIGFLGG